MSSCDLILLALCGVVVGLLIGDYQTSRQFAELLKTMEDALNMLERYRDSLIEARTETEFWKQQATGKNA